MTMDYYKWLRPILFLLPPETAHNFVLYALSIGLVPRPARKEYAELRNVVWGMDFSNPIGMAAGFDKNAEVIAPLLQQGFGFVEAGTVTPLPQSGNPNPRLFRLVEDDAIINRMGFNNDGCVPFLQKLEEWGTKRQGFEGIVGANIGKNKDSTNAIEDYLTLFEKIYGLSDYITINISSPNTPGLRGLQQRDELSALLSELMKRRAELTESFGKIPVLVKIAPDIDKKGCEDIAEVTLQYQVDGLIISNTTLGREGLQGAARDETGGLSGKPLMQVSTAVLKNMYRLTEAKIPIIGVGGVSSGDDAYAKIRAGASLVQVYSAFVYKGFGLVEQIKSRLVERLKADGFRHISEAVGADVVIEQKST